MKRLRQWADGRAARREQREHDEAFSEVFDQPTKARMRRWSDEELHRKMASNDLWPETLSLAQRELDRRKAWEAPAGRAFWISCAALLLAGLSMLVSLFR